jgi:TetR/AcrR family transcriptional repressor of nem operon
MSKGEKTREFIIERSAPIFNRKGIAATAMSDIMDATKLAKGSLYVHFKNKDLLVEAVIDHNLGLLRDKITLEVAKANTAKDKLFRYIDALTHALTQALPGGCPIINFGSEADDTSPRISATLHQAAENTQKSIADIIKSGIKAGEFKTDWNYREFATVMFAMIEGGVVISRLARNNSRMNVITKTLRQMIAEKTISKS